MHPLAYLPALIITLLVLMPMGLIRLANTEIIITNHRVLGRIRSQRISIKFEEIDSVKIRRGMFGIVFNYGTLTVKGNGMQMRFSGLIGPKKIKALIDKEVEMALFGEILSKEKDIPKKPATEKPAKAQAVKTPSFKAEQTPPPVDDKPRKNVDPNQW